MVDLLPCPFCGGKGRLHQNSTAKALWRVICDNCDAGPHGNFGEDGAVRLWNNRALIPDVAQPMPEDVETLKRLADSMGFGRTHDAIRRILAALAAQPPAAPVETDDLYTCRHCQGRLTEHEPGCPVLRINAEEMASLKKRLELAEAVNRLTAPHSHSSAEKEDDLLWPPNEMADLMDALARSADRHTNSYSETAHLARNAAKTIRDLTQPQTAPTREDMARIIDPRAFDPNRHAEWREIELRDALKKVDAILALTRPHGRCQKCGTTTNGEEAWVDGQIWCHPCADTVALPSQHLGTENG